MGIESWLSASSSDFEFQDEFKVSQSGPLGPAKAITSIVQA